MDASRKRGKILLMFIPMPRDAVEIMILWMSAKLDAVLSRLE